MRCPEIVFPRYRKPRQCRRTVPWRRKFCPTHDPKNAGRQGGRAKACVALVASAVAAGCSGGGVPSSTRDRLYACESDRQELVVLRERARRMEADVARYHTIRGHDVYSFVDLAPDQRWIVAGSDAELDARIDLIADRIARDERNTCCYMLVDGVEVP